MLQLQDVVRAKVDEYRLTEKFAPQPREDRMAALLAVMPLSPMDVGADRGPLARCPWSTCQATKHN